MSRPDLSNGAARSCTRVYDGQAVLSRCQGRRKPCKSAEADARTRTGDPFITSEVLYQLSYVGG